MDGLTEKISCKGYSVGVDWGNHAFSGWCLFVGAYGGDGLTDVRILFHSHCHVCHTRANLDTLD
jgi:hypothetical protein